MLNFPIICLALSKSFRDLKSIMSNWHQISSHFFTVSSVMGIQFSESGLSISSHKTHPVKHFARPQSQRQCREFLGLYNWFCRWMPGHACIDQSITASTQRDCKFHLSPACEAAFLKLKELLRNSPVLRFANLDLLFTLICDASLSGIGYTLFIKVKVTQIPRKNCMQLNTVREH